MASVSGVSTISKIFTKLGDNTGSVIPMYAKDFTSDTLTSATYFKEGGNLDGVEKTFEEFGTGVLWLGGIPFIKKHLFDNFLYPKMGINPDIDAKRLFSGDDSALYGSVEYAKQKAKSLGPAFSEQTGILEDTIKNKNLAKKLSLGKFAFSTAATGLALFGLITLKQKHTEKEIEKQVQQKHKRELYNKQAISKTPVYQMFMGNQKKNSSKDTSFTGLKDMGTFFMTNPVANTAIVDCVITGTRLKQSRKGEKFEVGLKEFCELLFIYGLAQPLQKGMETASKKFFKKPIDLDYAVLDSNAIKQAIDAEQKTKGSSSLLQDAKKLIELSNPETKTKDALNEASKKVVDFVFDNGDSELAEIFKKSGDIATFKTKQGTEQLSLLSSIDTDKLKKTAQKTVELIENAANKGSSVEYLKQTKFLKGAAIIANIAISAILMGYLQPKLNLYLRKKLHNGDNTNPAIKNLTDNIEHKFAFKGDNENNALKNIDETI